MLSKSKWRLTVAVCVLSVLAMGRGVFAAEPDRTPDPTVASPRFASMCD